MVKVNQELVDKIAELEVDALIKALEDPELRKDPSILARTRTFLKDNKLVTTPETPGVAQIKKNTIEIPNFADEIGGVQIQ